MWRKLLSGIFFAFVCSNLSFASAQSAIFNVDADVNNSAFSILDFTFSSGSYKPAIWFTTVPNNKQIDYTSAWYAQLATQRMIIGILSQLEFLFIVFLVLNWSYFLFFLYNHFLWFQGSALYKTPPQSSPSSPPPLRKF